ncbi:hypothetical protein [Szabonella alba]|uniref:Uncharacterized protein n=1 Tax=Szabonella alba TaxID=2804194 RepID=A0A8K0VFI8_9RHOB|nr:hypothetical protein [Szabonella alba]MBL4918734.1 hypothetical protein [Szabonella alba]
MKDTAQRLMGVMALMYFGPLMAGLGNHGFGVLPLFVAIFLIWLAVLAPERFPLNPRDWRGADFRLAMLSRALLQIVLVLVLFGIGRGIGGALGVLPEIPLVLPLAMSFLAVPLARLIHDPAAAARREFALGMLEPLEDLPAETSDRELSDHLEVLRQHVPCSLIKALLAEKTQAGTASTAARRALALLHDAGPEAAPALPPSGQLGQA